MDKIETRDPPSLANKLLGPLMFLSGGLFILVWFFYSVFTLLLNLSKPVIVLEKGDYYFLGAGIGMLTLGIVAAIEFWGGKAISKKRSALFTKLGIASVIIMLLLPHVIHFTIDRYLEQQEYTVCEAASHRWLFVRTIVYVQSQDLCSESLQNDF